MLVSVIGTPTPLTLRIATIVEAFGHIITGGCVRLEANESEDVSATIGRFDRENEFGLIVLSSGAQGVDFVQSEGIPIIVVAEGLAVTAESIAPSVGNNFYLTMKSATRALCALAPLIQEPSILCFIQKEAPYDAESVASVIGDYLGHHCSPAELKAIGQKAAGLWDGTSDQFLLVTHEGQNNLPSNFNASEAELLSVLAAPYDGILTGHGMRTAHWPSSIFHHAGPETNGVIDLTGPSRCLTYGPYFHLPTGRYRATIEFETADNKSSNRIGADVFNGSFLAVGEIFLCTSGVYAFDLGFSVSDSMLPIEIRLLLRNGAIEGQLLLRTVVIEPLPPGDEKSDL